MRQIPPKGVMFVDAEGFPRDMVTGGGHVRDKESGELVNTKIYYLRKRPELRLTPRIDSLLCSDGARLRRSEGRRFTGFRIQQFTRKRAWEGPWDESSRFSIYKPKLQTCVYLKNGSPVHYTRRPVGPENHVFDVARRGDYPVRQEFRVPKQSLPEPSPEQPHRNPNTISVNIWQEFIFGKSVIRSRTTSGSEGRTEDEDEDEGPVAFVRRLLGLFLHSSIVGLLMHVAYFMLFFVSCVAYSNVCELGCYVLLAQHLKIHERAYKNNLHVEFTGSVFQGPLYVLTRSWCEHCLDRERGQVFVRLMKRMKTDILGKGTNDEASPLNTSKKKTP